MQTDVQSRRKGRTIPRNPLAYNPESNGAIEKGVRDVTEQSRTVKIGLESRVKDVIPEDSAIVEWILEHGAFLINKYSVGHDGMTPHERLTGAKWRRPLVELGEIVMAKLVGRKKQKGKKEKKKRKLAEQSVEAIWVGQVARTGEPTRANRGPLGFAEDLAGGGDAPEAHAAQAIPQSTRSTGAENGRRSAREEAAKSHGSAATAQ